MVEQYSNEKLELMERVEGDEVKVNEGEVKIEQLWKELDMCLEIIVGFLSLSLPFILFFVKLIQFYMLLKCLLLLLLLSFASISCLKMMR